MNNPTQFLDTLIGEIDAGRRAALCVIVATRGSTPQSPGAMLCVDEAAQTTGTVGGGCVEADVLSRAHQVLSTGKSKLLTFELDLESASDGGMVCGGQMDVAISVISQPDQAQALRQAAELVRRGEAATFPIQVQTSEGLDEYRIRVQAPPKLLIAGGGHIGRGLATMMVPLNFQVSVVDDRTNFANAKRFPPPIEPVVGDIGETLARWPIDANTYVVVVTRGHKHDENALAAVIDSPAKYIGMIGSRRKIAVIFNALKQQGVTPDRFQRVHAPIGLDINAVTPEEIALSIAAELVSIHRTEHIQAVEGPFTITGGAT